MGAVLYFLNIFFDVGQSTLSKAYTLKHGKLTVFCFDKSVAAFALFALFVVVLGFDFHLPTLIYGAFYGATLCASMQSGMVALSAGPLALTSIMASFSLIIPFVFGIFVFDEKITQYGIIGIILLMLSIVLLNYKKEENVSLKWFAFSLLTLVSNGIGSIIQKYHQIYYPGKYRIEFMIFSMLAAVIIFGTFAIAEKQKVKFDIIGVLSGVLNGFASYIVLFLAATQKASVLFPIVSVGKIIGVCLVSIILFKEKLRVVQVIGLTSGIVAIILLNT